MKIETASTICICSTTLNESYRYYPCYIVGINREIIRVFIGDAIADLPDVEDEDIAIGIYVLPEDYHKIDHERAYYLLCNPRKPTQDELDLIFSETFDLGELSTDDVIHVGVSKEDGEDISEIKNRLIN